MHRALDTEHSPLSHSLTQFNTPLLGQLPQTFVDFMKSKIPMGRFAEVDEIVALLCWLLSEECSFSTAAVFDLSGGRATY